MANPYDTYCTVAECESPTRQGRTRCDFHEKRHQRGQSLTAPKAERLDPKARLLEAAHRYADADAEDDGDFDKRERDLLKAARTLAPAAQGELVRKGMAEAKRRGVHVGRPHEVTPEEALEMVQRLGTIALAARALGKCRDTVRAALKRAGQGNLPLRGVRGKRRGGSGPSSPIAA